MSSPSTASSAPPPPRRQASHSTDEDAVREGKAPSLSPRGTTSSSIGGKEGATLFSSTAAPIALLVVSAYLLYTQSFSQPSPTAPPASPPSTVTVDGHHPPVVVGLSPLHDAAAIAAAAAAASTAGVPPHHALDEDALFLKDPMAPWPYRTVATVLLSPDFYRPFFLSTLICVAWYTTIIRLTRSTITSTRQKAWVLTLLSSLVMIIVGSRMTLDFILLPTNATIADLPSLDSPLAWALSAFFLAYLAVDVVIGTRFYPDQFGFISGWVHHLGYAYCVFSLLQRAQIGSFLAFGAILELSTVPLALGHIDKRMRRDWVFGGLFFVTRVVFHAYVVYHAISVYHRSWYWIVPTLPWPLHVHWFLQWVKQQRRLKKKQLATSTSTAVAAAVPVQRSKKDE